MKRRRLIFVLALFLLLPLVPVVYSLIPRTDDALITHQWDERKQRWVHIEWRRTGRPVEKVDDGYLRYNVAWSRIWFESGNRNKYQNDDMPWGVVESLEDFLSKGNAVYTDGRPSQEFEIDPDRVRMQ